MKNMKKLISFGGLLVLLLHIFLPALVALADNNDVNHGTKYLTNVRLTDGNNNELVDGYTVKNGDQLQIDYDFVLPNDRSVAPGSYMLIPLPDVIRLTSNGTIDVKNASGQLVAVMHPNIDTNEVKLVFSSFVQENNNVKGKFSFWTTWQITEADKDKNVSVAIPVNGTTKVVTVIDGTVKYDGEYDYGKVGRINAYDKTLIEWRLDLNVGTDLLPEKKLMKDVKITDKLGANQVLIPNSFKVVNQREEVLQNIQPILSEDLKSFTVDIGDTDDSVFIFYQTRATDGGVAGEYENSAVFERSNGQGLSGTVKTPKSGGSGEGDGTTGSVVLLKTDGTTKVPLAGAIFRLENEQGDILVSTLTTNVDGKIALSDLLIGKYQFVEIEAPENYQIDTKPVPFEINLANIASPVTVSKENFKIVKPEDPEPSTPKPEDPEPSTPKPEDPDPSTPKPEDPDPGTPKPEDPDPSTPKPEDPDPSTPKPEDPDPSTPKPEDPDPSTPKPEDPDPSTPKPEDPDPSTPKPEEPDGSTLKPNPEKNEVSKKISAKNKNKLTKLNNNESGDLPKTGENTNYLVTITGVIFMITAIIFNRKNLTKKEG